MNKPTSNPGECFEPGQVWLSPRGMLWCVVGYAARPGMRKQAVLHKGEAGDGRKSERDWDAVDGWVICIHADGRKTPAGQGQGTAL